MSLLGDSRLEKFLLAGWSIADAISILREDGAFDRSVSVKCPSCPSDVTATGRDILERDSIRCACGRMFTNDELFGAIAEIIGPPRRRV